MNFAIDIAGISAAVKLAVDGVKLVWPDASSAVVVSVAAALSLLLSSLGVLSNAPSIDAASIYATVTQSVVVFGVAVGLTEVQKRAESKRLASGEPKRKIG